MEVHDSLVSLIGGTPLVRLNRVTEGCAAQVVAKVEYMNPGGSVKDRIALRMIEEAEASGALQPGGTIVEPTSGNTGVGLAIVAQTRGYSCVFVCPDKVAKDKVDVLRAYGARVEVCPTAVDPEDPRSYYSVSDRLAREIPGAWKPDQYSNPANPRSHYETTGPEVWRQTDGRVTHFVAGAGTGGTLGGVGRYLKEQSEGRVQVIGADPVGSVYSGGTGRPYLVEGVGEDFWPETFDPEIVGADPEGSIYSGGEVKPYLVEGVGEDFWPAAYDPKVPARIVAVSDADSFAMTRRLAREEGLLVGGSCGMAVVAALDVARRLGADASDQVVVVLLPDGGRGYLTKIFNDRWMASYGFVATHGEATVVDVLRAKSGSLPDLVHTHPSETVRDAIEILREYGVSQMPVVNAEPPVMAGEVSGSVSERDLLQAVFSGRARLSDRVDQHMAAPMPQVGGGEPLDAARHVLEEADAVMVLVDGKPAGVLTRHDLLGFLAS